MIRYAVVIEKGPNNYGAFAPDVPGCGTVGDSIEEVCRNIKEALELHLEGLAEDGEVPPQPTTHVEYVDVQEPVEGKRVGGSKPPRRRRGRTEKGTAPSS